MGACARRRHAGLLALAAALIALAIPAQACASTAMLAGGTDLTYNAAAGETNNLTVARDGTLYRLTDPTATITPTAPCVTVTIHEVTCPVAPVTDLSVSLGDMNDTGTLADSVSHLSSSSFDGGTGIDTLNGGAGQGSSLFAGDGNDVVNAGAAGDRVAGGVGDDVENGGPGDDNFGDFDPGTDTLNGNGGADSFTEVAADGPDTLSGGAGSDFLNYINRRDPVTVTADGVGDDGSAGEGDNVMPDFERIDGGFANDLIVGGPLTESLFGNGGDDVVSGGDGNDSLFGGDGNDTLSGDGGDDTLFGQNGSNNLNGGDGDDTLNDTIVAANGGEGSAVFAGGPGSDTVRYAGGRESVFVTLDGVANDGVAGELDNAMPDLENITGGNADDTLVGNASANQLDGGSGADTLSGLDGSDGLVGGRGDDSLDGGAAQDSFDGGSGADSLRSRDTGPDEASCGAGADTVLADQADDVGADCEAVSAGVVIATTSATVSGGTTKLTLACPAAEGIACHGTLTLSRAAKGGGKSSRAAAVLGAAKFTIPSGLSQKVKVNHVSTGGRSSLPVEAGVVMTDATGAKVRTTQRLVLHRKAPR